MRGSRWTRASYEKQVILLQWPYEYMSPEAKTIYMSSIPDYTFLSFYMQPFVEQKSKSLFDEHKAVASIFKCSSYKGPLRPHSLYIMQPRFSNYRWYLAKTFG